MIRTGQALRGHYRGAVSQGLGPFHNLDGPNPSGRLSSAKNGRTAHTTGTQPPLASTFRY